MTRGKDAGASILHLVGGVRMPGYVLVGAA
jgi:hypothetical protein